MCRLPSPSKTPGLAPKASLRPLKAGPLFDKHLKRLMNIGGTTFVSYDSNTGVWVFKVPHYTRYGLDYDDDEMEDDDRPLSAPPDSIDQYKNADMSVMEIDSSDSESSSRQEGHLLIQDRPWRVWSATNPRRTRGGSRTKHRTRHRWFRALCHVRRRTMSDNEMAGAHIQNRVHQSSNLERPMKPILKPAGNSRESITRP